MHKIYLPATPVSALVPLDTSFNGSGFFTSSEDCPTISAKLVITSSYSINPVGIRILQTEIQCPHFLKNKYLAIFLFSHLYQRRHIYINSLPGFSKPVHLL